MRIYTILWLSKSFVPELLVVWFPKYIPHCSHAWTKARKKLHNRESAS